jgi:hypothetical protein
MIKMNRADPITSKMNRVVMHQVISDDSPIAAFPDMSSGHSEGPRKQITIIMFSTVKIHRNV